MPSSIQTFLLGSNVQFWPSFPVYSYLPGWVVSQIAGHLGEQEGGLLNGLAALTTNPLHDDQPP